MYPLLELYISAPAWLRGAVIGGIAGALGGVLSYPLSRWPKIQRGAAIAFIAVGFTAGPKIIDPIVTELVANKDLPKKIDEVTTLLEINFEPRATIYFYELADAIGDSVDVNAIKTTNIDGLCSNWKSSFLETPGFEARYNYRFRGEWVGFVVTSSDCL